MSASPLRHIPNIITIGRVVLVAPTAWYLWMEMYVLALALMAVAGASDAVDGWLARQCGWTSRFGATVDPLADKLLVGVLVVVLMLQQHLPIWLAAIALGRDVVILVGAGAYRWTFGDIEIQPRWLSKANTAVQIALVLLVLLALCEFPTVSDWAYTLAYPYGILLVAVLGVTSGTDYVLSWGRKAFEEHQARS